MRSVVKGLTGLLAILFCITLIACSKEEPKEEPKPEPEPEVVEIFCPLDHATVADLPERVFAVAVDNGPNSQPQTGLNAADFLFEVPVEGGINRFLALYYHEQPEVIGPVRSARHYFIDLTQSFQAIYVHCGGSYLAKSALTSVEDIDEMGAAQYFWRDKSRKAPVNLYTSWQKLTEAAAAKDWLQPTPTTSYDFWSPEEAANITAGGVTEIDIPYTYKPVSYIWDEATQHYLRFSKGEPHVDAADNQQLYADNLIILAIDTKVVDREAGLLDMSFITAGERGTLVQKGVATPITWSMAQAGAPLEFKNEEGVKVKLLAGRTIVQVVPKTVTVNYHDSQAVAETE